MNVPNYTILTTWSSWPFKCFNTIFVYFPFGIFTFHPEGWWQKKRSAGPISLHLWVIYVFNNCAKSCCFCFFLQISVCSANCLPRPFLQRFVCSSADKLSETATSGGNCRELASAATAKKRELAAKCRKPYCKDTLLQRHFCALYCKNTVAHCIAKTNTNDNTILYRHKFNRELAVREPERCKSLQ